MSANTFVGRQPIFNRKENIFAYELLYRNSEENIFPNVAPEKATIELLLNTFFHIGYKDIADRTKIFVNFTEELLHEDMVNQLDPRLVVIEILEDVEITTDLIRRLKELKQKGFMFALDDFIIQHQTAIYEELYKIVHIVKVDFMATSADDMIQIEALLKRYRHLVLLAEKVETKEAYDYALQHGYKLFQGYYFAKPEVVKGKNALVGKASYLHLFQKLNESEPNINDITNMIKRDVSLSYKILRYINSLAFNMPNKISSIQQAVMMMGLNETRKWLQLLLFYDIGSGEAKGRERALIELSINRAKMCELIASHNGNSNADEYFLLGMFSCLDVIMQDTWSELLPQLSLTNEIEATLLGNETSMQPYLKLVKASETFDLALVADYADLLGLSIEKVSEISLEAHRWALKFD